jgi:hypothetical protein
MITQNVRLPRWRAAVLCLAGVLAMIKPLASGVSLYRETLPAPVTNYSEVYGWVADAGPFTPDELSRGHQRLRVIGFPRDRFGDDEVARAAAEVRASALADIRRHRAEAEEHSRRALADRAVAVLMSALGAGGICFYLWLGYVLITEADGPRDPRATWFGRKRRHGRITFGRVDDPDAPDAGA